MKICSVDKCPNKYYARGLCNKHYIRLLKHGNPFFIRIGRHGYTYHPLYGIWASIKQRCYNKNNKYYKYYGGRGVRICDEWRNSAKTFIKWALPLWEKGLTIDRRDNNGNYCPDNCRFVTHTININNTRLLRITNKSGYRGVSYNKKRKKWIAKIAINGKTNYLGSFDSPRLAALRYDVEAYLNDDRPRNFIL